jgi:hypothetical protein
MQIIELQQITFILLRHRSNIGAVAQSFIMLPE